MRLVQRIGAIVVATVTTTMIGTAPGPVAAQDCTADTGVVVVVDFGALGGSVVSRCVPGTPETGYAALQEAGFRLAGTAHDGAGFVCRIDGRPGPEQESCDDTPSGDAYWSYWVDEPGGNGWSYSNRGALASYPEVDRIEGWSFGAGDPPGLAGAVARSRFTDTAPGDPDSPDADRPGAPDRPSPGDPAAPPEEPRTPDRAELPDTSNPEGDDGGAAADQHSDAPGSSSPESSAEEAARSAGSSPDAGDQPVADGAAEQTTGGFPWATLIAFAAIWVLGIAAGIAARRRRRAG